MTPRFARASAPTRARRRLLRSESCFHVARTASTGNEAAMAGPVNNQFVRVLEVMKKAGGVLNDAEIPWALGGGLACWARGGPETEHDVDILVKPDDADRAQEAFAEAGLKTERPPEGWLIKAWVDDVLVDLIFEPQDGPVDDDLFARAEELE